ncbi:SGNH/GDSL hydrolase family protein [Nocardia sp. BMG111209]|uniref:SGNH/GDSL hydrolase family protein n=1 Tax=Nocardia sp. BMG111209 TaxID=1160137 RepID=UPI0009DB77D5|nr:SGNH/GDSL hydrolase family protein [Nocardia sp. BMG111209]
MRTHEKRTPIMRRLAHTAAVSALAVGGAAAFTAPAAAGNAEIHYVALGDSFAAGSGVFPERDLNNCLQSQVDYPSLVAQQLHATTFRDATCGGATLANLYGPQPALIGGGGATPPQFDALTPGTTLVTLTMGGNDIGLAAQALNCFNPLPQPFGHSCTEGFTAGGGDGMGDRLAGLVPTYGRALDDIHARAPRATVLVVGYPTVSSPGGCPQQPAWPADVDYLNSVLARLNDLLRTAAARHDAHYVDTAAPSVGHDMCAAPDRQWVNGLIPSLSTPSVVPLHPNTLGEQAIAREVVAALG